MKISDETGLPELPDGYYWNVQRHYADDRILHVALCRKRRFPLSDQAIDLAVADIGLRSPDAEVLRAAKRSYERSKYKIGAEVNEAQARADALVGKYPPKRLVTP